MPQRTLYDRVVDKLKNNKFVVALLLASSIIGGVLSFVERARPLVDSAREKRDSASGVVPNPILQYAQVMLATEEHWREVKREEANYFFEREMSLAHDDSASMRELNQRKSQGDFVCPWMFASHEWCATVAAFFSQKGLQSVAIDPKFDITLLSGGGQSILLQTLSVEIAYAKRVLISLGDWTTKRVPVDATYEIAMPPLPESWLKIEGVRELIEDHHKLRQRVTAEEVCSFMSISGDECTWPDLPTHVSTRVGDPIYLRPGEPYRFQLVLRDYHRLPNNVVLRFAIGTNAGEVYSPYYYLLSM